MAQAFLSGMTSAKSIDEITSLVKKEILKRDQAYKNCRIDVSFKDGAELLEDLDKRAAKTAFKIVFPENKKFMGRLILPVEVYENGVAVEKVNIRTNIAIVARVASNINKMAKGQTLTADNIGFVEKDISYLPSSAVLDPAKIIGKETTTFIPKGTTLLEWMFRKTPLVKKGDEVVIIKNAKGIMIKARAVALYDGYLGGIVTVRNIDSGKTVEGRVTASGEVEAL